MDDLFVVEGGRAPLRPHIGRLEDAVEGPEGYDPSGLRINAEDTPNGVAVQLGVGAGVAAPDPSTALGWSVPLRDLTGRRIEAIGPLLLYGYVRALLGAPPDGLAAPSNLMFYAGFCPDGPLATATKGLVFILRNTTAGGWLCEYRTKASGVWSPQTGAGAAVNPTGVHGVWGGPNIAGNTSFGICAAQLPAPNGATSVRNFTAVDLTGSDPHLVFGAGWSGEPAGPDSVVFTPLATLTLPDPV